MHEATPSDTLCDRSCWNYIQDDYFCRLAGPVTLTGKAIVPMDRVLTLFRTETLVGSFVNCQTLKIVQFINSIDVYIFVSEQPQRKA